MSDKIIESLEAARPVLFRPGSAIDPATRNRELTAAFSGPAGSARRHRRGRPDRRPLAAFAAALAAALSVALIATGVWLAHPPLARPTKGTGKGHASPHPTKSPVHPAARNLLSAPVAKPPPVARAQAGMPPYYVVTEDNSSVVDVRSTTTGELLSEVTLPANVDTKLVKIGAGPRGRFVLALFALPNIEFYLLKVSDNGLSAQLSALSVPPITGHKFLTTVALSPDGAKLAFGFQVNNQQATITHGAIEVVTLATGATRTWTSGTQQGWPAQLSWTDHGHDLGIYWYALDPNSHAGGLWELDPAAPGSDLFSGRHALPQFVGSDVVQTATFTPDGKTIDAAVQYAGTRLVHRGTVVSGIVKLSARTGRPLSTLLAERAIRARAGYRSYSQLECQLVTADPAGNHLLVAAADAPGNHPPADCASFGRLDRARFTRLPESDPQVVPTVAW